jgi:hypothetical protein
MSNHGEPVKKSILTGRELRADAPQTQFTFMQRSRESERLTSVQMQRYCRSEGRFAVTLLAIRTT